MSGVLASASASSCADTVTGTSSSATAISGLRVRREIMRVPPLLPIRDRHQGRCQLYAMRPRTEHWDQGIAIATARISRLEGMEGHAKTADVRLEKWFPDEKFNLSPAEK